MTVHVAVGQASRVDESGRRYLVMARGAAVALALACGIALGTQPALAREDSEGAAAVTVAVVPHVADRWYDESAAVVAFPRVADRWYAEAATSPTFLAVADRWFDEPAVVAASDFPHMSDRWFDE